MFDLGAIDWQSLIIPDTPVLEIFIRGTVMYFALFALLRWVQKRPSSSLSTSDVIVIVLLADAAQNGMADDYRSLPDGVILVSVIVGSATTPRASNRSCTRRRSTSSGTASRTRATCVAS